MRFGRLGFGFWSQLRCGWSTRSSLHAPKPQPRPSPPPLLPFVHIQKLPRRKKEQLFAAGTLTNHSLQASEGEMSLQYVAPPVRALAVLPAPGPPRRRTSHVSLYLPSRRPGLAVAPVRAAESSSPPTVPASAAGKAVVPDDEFSLAKVRSLRYFLLLGTWLQRFGGCHSEQSNADSAVVCRSLSVWSGWGLGSRSCREFWIFFLSCRCSCSPSPRDSECSVVGIMFMFSCTSGTDSDRISTCFLVRNGQLCC